MLSGELDNAFPLPLLALSVGRAGNHSERDLTVCAAWEQARLSCGTAVPQKHVLDPNEAKQVVHPAPLTFMNTN